MSPPKDLDMVKPIELVRQGLEAIAGELA